mmetsp:Transcript_7814/g.16959  ORF Transcript_7814/g.16959 Transcript_7814/m.16959 type:complete len:193 (-) Transcript_7814:350-928(-)|eukprot:CAMPEP_0113324038 /NCGR_PEP_ID=MMETSP0010_2-20120614/16769_1 /TAXON_ID=216773 ORGANISM="Corethron hystrix, Strain 308" /NCGR_SAMPLE_ID=MMETSP0010_2 /ASSEMBLY_ACC=CAM_ASM_000155 /LENGTH=192 /DNA_ID=CAMNT_0000183265 /DNA_START=43 /DNA_END=621 /DNA_ORIENTATION=+ /assembly_acc=CAM_ASM_000155
MAQKAEEIFPVFGYGSNCVEQLAERVGNDNLLSSPGRLPNHERIFCGYSGRWEGPVASVREKRSSIVHGTIVYLTQKEIEKLDVFEGCNSEKFGCKERNQYRREKILVEEYSYKESSEDARGSNNLTVDKNTVKPIISWIYIKNDTNEISEPNSAYVRNCVRNVGQHWPNRLVDEFGELLKKVGKAEEQSKC